MNIDGRRQWGTTCGIRHFWCMALIATLGWIALPLIKGDVASAQEKKGSPLPKFFDHEPPIVTGRVGWVSEEQAGVQIDDFRVEVVKRGRVITGSPTRLKIHIVGKMRATRGRLPYVREIFVSERLTDEQSVNRYVDVQLTPLVETGSKTRNPDDPVPFDVTAEYKLYGYQWDGNRYLFHCGKKTVDMPDVIRRGK